MPRTFGYSDLHMALRHNSLQVCTLVLLEMPINVKGVHVKSSCAMARSLCIELI
jgi:hypothetical protein